MSERRRAYARAWSQRRRQSRRERGLCLRCGHVPVKQFCECQGCRVRNAARAARVRATEAEVAINRQRAAAMQAMA